MKRVVIWERRICLYLLQAHVFSHMIVSLTISLFQWYIFLSQEQHLLRDRSHPGYLSPLHWSLHHPSQISTSTTIILVPPNPMSPTQLSLHSLTTMLSIAQHHLSSAQTWMKESWYRIWILMSNQQTVKIPLSLLSLMQTRAKKGPRSICRISLGGL